jgi:hypothetical protein
LTQRTSIWWVEALTALSRREMIAFDPAGFVFSWKR